MQPEGATLEGEGTGLLAQLIGHGDTQFGISCPKADRRHGSVEATRAGLAIALVIGPIDVEPTHRAD